MLLGFPQLSRTLALGLRESLSLSQHWALFSALTDPPGGSGKYYFLPCPFRPRGGKGFPLWPVSGDTPHVGFCRPALASISFPFTSVGWPQVPSMCPVPWKYSILNPISTGHLWVERRMSTKEKAAFPGVSWNISLLVALSSSCLFKKKVLPIC